MFRRSSYASIVSGSGAGSGQPPFQVPARSGVLPHTANSNPSPGPPPPQPSSHSRHHSRTGDFDGHHNSMHNSVSTSWGRAGPLPSYSSQFGYGGTGYGGLGQDAPPFFVPSYLKGSKHAERVEETYKAKVAAQREHRSNHSSNAGSLSTSSSSVNLHKNVGSYRGMTHDIIERQPPSEESTAPWPTRWSEHDKFTHLDVSSDGLEVTFSGSHKSHEEAASIRADHPMPRQCGIYYFEVTIMSKGKDGMIGIGFSSPKVTLNRIPGWEPESYAYHGDDGNCFSNTTSGKPYGPKFTTLDTVGCGVNFRTGTAFFTRNGHHLGVAFRDLKLDRLYPTVGMKKPGETLRANFGQSSFVYDIDKMVDAEKQALHAEINKMTVTLSDRDETSLIHELVARYLAHDGYVETARAFAEEVSEESKALSNTNETALKYLNAEEDLHAINRQRIRAAILDGDIDKALKHTRAYYPKVLNDNENIYFKLRCRKFIEMIRQCTELQQTTSTAATGKRTSTNGHSAQSDDYDVFDHQMELDEQFGNDGAPTWGTDSMDMSEGLGNSSLKAQRLLEETINYGQELKAEFRENQRPEVKQALEDTFALIAYPDASQSRLAPLLEVSGRVPVAEELNSAILVSLKKSPSAALERLCVQTEALVDELAEDGGPGAFVNVRRDFLR